ncbi:MAG: hypothetical protein ACREJQ_00075, partial [bacterium]
SRCLGYEPMGPVYVQVDLEDPDDEQKRTYTISHVPFLLHRGEEVRATKAEQKIASSYRELRAILVKNFQVPKEFVPPAEYFEPTDSEKDEDNLSVYRTVPEGMDEPEWRRKARVAVVDALENADFVSDKGRISVNGCHCYSLQELQEELETIAERVGGRKQTPGEAYQPDYDAVVKEVLAGYSELLDYIGLPKKRRRRE